jgi:HTH-type transcriptional regulator, transcriptional repressor of NAD biosynthesis genes
MLFPTFQSIILNAKKINSMIKRGFTIGKFAPFHKGHQYLIETALKDMDEFYVVVYDTPEFGIDIETKVKWINEIFPNVKILKAYNSPKQFGLDEISVKIQMEYLSNIIKDIRFTHFYSSERYGKYVAKYLNLGNIIVDQDRKKYPISAKDIRNNIDNKKEYLNDIVYKDIKNICR